MRVLSFYWAVFGFWVFLFFYAPLISLYCFVLLLPSLGRVLSKRLLSAASILVFLNASLSYSVLLASRDYFQGADVGFGADLFHYANAFSFVESGSYSSLGEMLSGVRGLTGSSEPLFWILVRFFAFFSDSAAHMHVFISMLGFVFIYLGGKRFGEYGLLAFCLYAGTITCYAFQGSAIRSGLAFSIAFFAIACTLECARKRVFLLGAATATTHFSMLAFLPSFFFSIWNRVNLKRIFIVCSMSILPVLIFYLVAGFGGGGAIATKVAARAVEDFFDYSSVIQFFVESAFFFIVIYFFRRDVYPGFVFGCIFIFCLSVFFLFFAPSVFPRFYRYEYVFFLAILVGLSGRRGSGFLYSLVILAFCWNVFIVSSRYQGLFVPGGALDHMTFSLWRVLYDAIF